MLLNNIGHVISIEITYVIDAIISAVRQLLLSIRVYYVRKSRGKLAAIVFRRPFKIILQLCCGCWWESLVGVSAEWGISYVPNHGSASRHFIEPQTSVQTCSCAFFCAYVPVTASTWSLPDIVFLLYRMSFVCVWEGCCSCGELQSLQSPYFVQ